MLAAMCLIAAVLVGGLFFITVMICMVKAVIVRLFQGGD